MCFSSCFDINVSVQENLFASAHFDGIIRLWSVRSGSSPPRSRPLTMTRFLVSRFTPDEKYIVSTGK